MRLNKFFMRLPYYITLRGLMCLSEENIVEVGRITHFFSKISVAVVELTAPLVVGDRILVKGPSTDFEQVIESIQIEHQNIPRAEAGQSIGLKMASHVREKDKVYKKF
jgi:translation elongation factor EF-1alpha